MIILPGVAFDHTLSRLGHGKGYYDRFITSYVASGRTKPLLGSQYPNSSGFSLIIDLSNSWDMPTRTAPPKRRGRSPRAARLGSGHADHSG